MRAIDWLPSTFAGMALCIASVFLLAITLDERCNAPNPLYDVVFAGDRTTTATDVRHVDSPYGPIMYDSYASWEPQMILLAILTALLLSGAAATRIGTTLVPWRDALANALGCLALAGLLIRSEPGGLWLADVTFI